MAAAVFRCADAVGSDTDASQMSYVWTAAAGIASGLLGAMGMGGGGVLIIYLTLMAEVEQKTAQGINLLFFIPIAVIALFLHCRKHLVNWRAALPAALCGLAGAFLGTWLSGWIDHTWLQKAFGVLLFIIGIHEILAKDPKCDSTDQ
jgi:Predicted permeases